jgi:hypothetical protein
MTPALTMTPRKAKIRDGRLGPRLDGLQHLTICRSFHIFRV